MGRIIDALHEAQHETGYLSTERLHALSTQLEVPLYRLQELVSFYPHFRTTAPKAMHLAICRDISCRMASDDVLRVRLAEIAASRHDVEIEHVSCLGRCELAPAAAVNDLPICVADREAVENALCDEGPTTSSDMPRKWRSDPYAEAADQYDVLRKVLEGGFDADAVIQTLIDSRLRGMGGAGFPTGTKWKLVRAAEGDTKYVICNADESEPGTFKDRVVLAELPHLVIEGMVLGGLAVGAQQGIVFIRHEYWPERGVLMAQIERARQLGVLGTDVLGSGRPFDIEIAVSPGGYILGEETALLECLEDKRGEPRNKPPYPGQIGLWGKPTLINNVETFALTVPVLKDGADAWRARGKGDSPGLKFIALSGDVEKPDVYEVPMGTTIKELIELGGGMKDGKALYAIAPGGASSNFIRADQADLPLDFDALAEAGTMLGSGAVIVIAEGRDIVDLATNVVTFFRNESCGKCVPCRVGSEKAVTILEKAVQGRGSKKQLALIHELRDTMEQTSICGLGQVALNPFTSALACFEEEVRARFTEE